MAIGLAAEFGRGVVWRGQAEGVGETPFLG